MKDKKIYGLNVIYTVEIASVGGDCKKLASLGKKLLSSLQGFNNVRMIKEKEDEF